MSQQPQITFMSWVMVCLLGVTWGGTFMVMELALRGITPFWLASGRIGFAALLLTAVWGARGFKLFETRPKRGDIIALINVGLLSTAVPFMCLSWGQQYVTSGMAGVSMAAVALMVLPMAHFFVPGEQLTWRRGLGMVMGFAGVWLLIGGTALNSSGADLEWAGRIAVLMTTFCYAVSSILVRRLPPVDSIGLATIVLIIGAFLVFPAALIKEGIPTGVSGETLFWIAVLGLLPTAAANLLRVVLIRSAGPVFMSLVNFQVPVWSVIFGAWILSEDLPPTLFQALALILAGVALAQYGALKRLFSRSAPKSVS